jgi:antitoxin (DNA-binding transcriptional repressor) of toxin-antitoxin stability system
MPISRAKAQLLAIAAQVASTGESVVMTRRGAPLVRLVAIEPPASLKGSVTFLVDEDELIYAPLDAWDADKA